MLDNEKVIKELSDMNNQIDVLTAEKRELEAQSARLQTALSEVKKENFRLKDHIIKQSLIIDQMTKQDTFYVSIIETMISVIHENF